MQNADAIPAGVEVRVVMLSYGVALLAHILVVVYLLGADLGRFYLARSGASAAALPAERIAAARGAAFLGSVTSAALILVLLAGAQVAAAMGAYRIIVPGWFVATWVVTGTWLLLSVVADWLASRDGPPWAGWLDLLVRAAMGGGNFYDAILALQGGSRSVDSLWLAAKIGIFGLLILLSIPLRQSGWTLRRQLARLAVAPADAGAHARLTAALAAHRLPMVASWLLILVAAWLGVNKPG